MGRAAGLAIAMALTACASRARPPVGVTVVVDGDQAGAARARLARGHIDGLVLRPVAPPVPPHQAPDPAVAALATARQAYYADSPGFAACQAALEPIELPALLGAGHRELAARVLVWRAACAWGALDRAGAAVFADKLGSYGLDPVDEDLVTPDVEQLFARAIAAAGTAARTPVHVTGPAGARLIVDGRPAGCQLPCTTDATAGEHVVAALGDGFAPAWRVARVPADGAVHVAAQPASPDQAAAQWRDRIDRGLPVADDVGLKLVARATADTRVAYVVAGPHLSGAFVVNGTVKARVTRSDHDELGLVRDLAIKGQVLPAPPLYKQPKFWIASVLIAGLAAGITAAIVFDPGTRTSVGIGDH